MVSLSFNGKANTSLRGKRTERLRMEEKGEQKECNRLHGKYSESKQCELRELSARRATMCVDNLRDKCRESQNDDDRAEENRRAPRRTSHRRASRRKNGTEWNRRLDAMLAAT